MPDPATPPPAPSDGLYRMAVDELARGNDSAAESLCRELLASQPCHSAALHLTGVLAFRAGHPLQARALFEQAVAQADSVPMHAVTLAELLASTGHTDVALELIGEACRRFPADGAVHGVRARLLMQRGRAPEAAQELRAALAKHPADPALREALASACSALGDVDAAVDLLATLVAEHPARTATRRQLAQALAQAGRYEDALAALRAALDTGPEDPDAHAYAAALRLELGRAAEALDAIQALSASCRADHRVATVSAHLLRALDRNVEACALCEASVQTPELIHAHALALHAAGHSARALELLERCAALGGRAAVSHCDRGSILADLGRQAEAVAAFDTALALEPELADAWYNRGLARTCTADDHDIAAMEALAAGQRPYRDRMLLHYALGKAHEEAGDVDRAFHHWHRGNALKRATVTHDAPGFSRQVDRIIGARWDRVRTTYTGDPADGLNPVFIVGMPRCGSTLVEQILAAHPGVHAAGESLQLRACVEGYGPAAVEALRKDAPQVRAALGARLAAAGGGPARVVDKDLSNFLHVGALHALLPDAHVVYCRRDPMDTCLSAYTRLFAGDHAYTYDLAELGGYYRDHARLMQHWQRTVPATALLQVDYDELVANPRPVIGRLLAALGLPWDERCLRHFDVERAVTTASRAQVRQPIYRTSSGRSAGVHRHLGALIGALGDLGPGGA